FTTLDDPNATTATLPTSINDSGQIVGNYGDGGGTHGFLYSGGTFTTLDDPSATTSTLPLSINDSGQVVRTYSDGKGAHGFIANPPVAPTIAGTIAGQPTSAEAPVKPFSGVTIGDTNSGATDTLTIALSGIGGTLADGTGFTGLTATGT